MVGEPGPKIPGGNDGGACSVSSDGGVCSNAGAGGTRGQIVSFSMHVTTRIEMYLST